MSSTVYTVGVKINGSAAGLARAAKEALVHTKQMGASVGSEYTKMAKAREMLGVRSEREIQREIQQTQAAYNRLARAGNMSFSEQRRAAKALRDEVTQLHNEMGKLTPRQKAMRVAGGAAVAGAAVVATAAPKVRSAMEYDLEMTHLANTAYSDKDKAGRIAGRKELDAQVNDAVRYGGGTRDATIDTMQTLYGAGIFKPEEVKKILRESVMAGTANAASSVDLANMAVTAHQNMGIKPEQMERMFGMTTYAGQAGGFEIKQMAQYFPPQMAAAGAVGLSGERGVAKLAALNQVAMTTAGTKDEAGNNVVNLLAKLGSQDTIKEFKRMGIDLPKQLAEGRMKGKDALDVMGDVLQSQLAKDKNYKNVQKQLDPNKKGSEQQEALAAVSNIAQGTVIGQVFQDRQALMALYGFVNGRERAKSIETGALQNTDAASRNMETIRDSASFKTEQAANARDIAFQQSIDKMLPAIGGVADGLTSVMTQYPGYSTAIIGATTGLTALAGAAGLSALTTGGGVSGLSGMLAGAGGMVLRGGAVGTAGAIGYGVGTGIYKLGFEGNTAGNFLGEIGARIMSLLGSEDAKQALAVNEALKNSKVGGEVKLHVTGTPGLAFEAETMPFKGTEFFTKTGRTNIGAGY